jgi:hypothetical protein
MFSETSRRISVVPSRDATDSDTPSSAMLAPLRAAGSTFAGDWDMAPAVTAVFANANTPTV